MISGAGSPGILTGLYNQLIESGLMRELIRNEFSDLSGHILVKEQGNINYFPATVPRILG